MLTYGDSSTQVKELQVILFTAGYKISKIDGIFGVETKNAVISFQKDNFLTADGIVGAKTAIALQNIPINNLLNKGRINTTYNHNSNIKKSNVSNSEVNLVRDSYKKNMSQMLGYIVSTITLFLKANGEILTEQSTNGIQKLEELNARLNLTLKIKDSAMKSAKTNMAKLCEINLALNSLKKESFFRTINEFVSPTNYSESHLMQKSVNSWNKVQKAVMRALKSYKVKTKVQREIAKYTEGNKLIKKKIGTVGCGIKFSSFLGFLFTWGEFIKLSCTYEDTTKWNSDMEKCIYRLMDQLIIELIVALIPAIIAGMVAAGLISAPAAGVVGIICLVVGIVSGILIWMLEDNDIYISKYLQDAGYNTTYSLIYK